MSSSPRTAVWVTVPESCRMRAGFDGIASGPAIEFTLTGDGYTAAHLQFEPVALARLVAVARRMLAIPIEPGFDILEIHQPVLDPATDEGTPR